MSSSTNASIEAEEDDLQTALESDTGYAESKGQPTSDEGSVECDKSVDPTKKKDVIQWSLIGDNKFFPCGETAGQLIPGVYEISSSDHGIFFEKIPIKLEGLIRFPQVNSELVIDEIQRFWTLEDQFKKHSLSYKRGMLLWGPPGSGKSCTIQLLTHDVVARGGIALNINNPNLFGQGLRILRKIQPETPVIVIMEDLDALIYHYNESDILNILDGVTELHKIVFLATTNYPDRLGARVINRPSRFDKRFKIGHPDDESRKIYIEHLFRNDESDLESIDIEGWVEDTEGFSLAHIKELFVAHVILGDGYDDAVKILSSMRERVKPEEEFDQNTVGFGKSE
jgi:hypothetical protein